MSGAISTDDIIPARYKHMYTEREQLAPHAFEHRFPGLADRLKAGDAIVADEIFGIGSSREQAVTTLLGCGVRLILAPRFGRIFYRNCWNLGLPAVEIDTNGLPDHDDVTIEFSNGTASWDGTVRRFAPPPPLMVNMIQAGGLLELVLEGAVERSEF